jgi:hypothetical protein
LPDSLVARDTFLMTERGPALAPVLEPSQDRVWIVDRHGAFALSAITELTPSADVPAWRLLTEAGDIVLPAGVLAMTSAGPLEGHEIHKDLHKHGVIRLDIVSPEDLPPPRSAAAPSAAVYRSCLTALPGHVIQLPRGNGVADAVQPSLLEILEAADVGYRLALDDRWMAVVVDPIHGVDGAARVGWDLQADLLTLVTAWAEHEAGYESRIRLNDCTLRRRLLASIAGTGRSFSVRWLPGYCPVESRVRVGGERSWPARVAVIGVSPESAPTFRVRTESVGDLIISLAVLRAA